MTKTKISTKQLLIWVALAAIAFTAFGFGGTRGVSFASALIFVLGVFMFLGKKEKMAKGDKKSFFIWVLPFAVFVLLISFGRFWSTYHYDAGAGSIRWFSYFIAALFNVLGVVGYAMVGHCLSLEENSEGKTKERLFEVILCALALHVLINLIITLANYGPFYRTLYAGKSYYYGSVEYPVANERMILDGFTIATVSTQYGDISSFLLASTLPSLLFISLKENKIGFSIAAVSGGIGLLDLVLMPNHLALLLLIPVFSIGVFVRFVKTGIKTPLWEKIVGFAMLAMVAIVVFLMIGVAANGNNNYGPLSKIFNNGRLTQPINQIINAVFKNNYAWNWKSIFFGMNVYSGYSPLSLKTSFWMQTEITWVNINLHTFEFAALMEGGFIAFIALCLFMASLFPMFRNHLRREEKANPWVLISAVFVLGYFLYQSLLFTMFPYIYDVGLYVSAFSSNAFFYLTVLLIFFSYRKIYSLKKKGGVA